MNIINKGREITAMLWNRHNQRKKTNYEHVTQQLEVLTEIQNQNLCRWKWTF